MRKEDENIVNEFLSKYAGIISSIRIEDGRMDIDAAVSINWIKNAEKFLEDITNVRKINIDCNVLINVDEYKYLNGSSIFVDNVNMFNEIIDAVPEDNKKAIEALDVFETILANSYYANNDVIIMDGCVEKINTGWEFDEMYKMHRERQYIVPAGKNLCLQINPESCNNLFIVTAN